MSLLKSFSVTHLGSRSTDNTPNYYNNNLNVKGEHTQAGLKSRKNKKKINKKV